jgi:replicative DNA helicase
VTFRSLHDEMQDAFDYVEMLMNRGGELTGLPTGYPEIDEITGGLQPGELVIVAARPSMGKTALALNIARNAAVDHGKKAAVFSLEMTTRSLVLRLLAAEAGIDSGTFRRGFIAVADHRKLVDAAGRLSHADLWIDDSGSLTVLEMKAKARRLKAERGLDLVVVDYLQLAKGEGDAERREQEISEISRGLKALAKELHIPVVALSQLNRGPETRRAEDKRPILADLRESGAIEQDADVIAFIYRDCVYNPDADPAEAELIIAKQRNGPTGTLKLRFESRFARFAPWLDRDAPPGMPPGGRGFVPPDRDGGFDDEPPF